jgi:hypothetical protein
MLRVSVITTGLVVLGLAGVGVAAAPPQAESAARQVMARVSRTTPFAADCNRAQPPTAAYVDAEVEPYVAINPRHERQMIAVYQEDRYPNDGANGVLAARTSDGGATWSVPPLAAQPSFARCSRGDASNGGDYEKASDPWVSFDSEGRAYFVAVSYNDSNWDTSELVSTSSDQGRTWGPPATLIRDNQDNLIDDRPAVTADPTRADTAYVVWERHFSAPADKARGEVYFAMTRDGGRSWSTARPIYRTPLGQQTSANQIVVLPNGDLLNVFTQLALGAGSTHPRHDRIVLVRSSDGGRSWSPPTTVARTSVKGVSDPRTGDLVRVGDSFTDVAVDPRSDTHNVYVVWGDARFTRNGDQQIALVRSRDGGRTWSAPRDVSSNRRTQAFVPSVAVNDQGAVAVTYYDFTSDSATSRALATDYWFTQSSDRAETWSSRQQVTTRPFDLRTAPYNGGFFLGEYQGLAGTNAKFIATATITNDRNLLNRTDIRAVQLPRSR